MDTHGRPGPQGSIELNLRLTQGELASMIGATRESVNKQLGAFRNEGVVAIDRQRIVILRPQHELGHTCEEGPQEGVERLTT